MRFVRLDGSTAVRERQALIDRFTNDTDIFVFLLSTKVRCFCSAVRCFSRCPLLLALISITLVCALNPARALNPTLHATTAGGRHWHQPRGCGHGNPAPSHSPLKATADPPCLSTPKTPPGDPARPRLQPAQRCAGRGPLPPHRPDAAGARVPAGGHGHRGGAHGANREGEGQSVLLGAVRPVALLWHCCDSEITICTANSAHGRSHASNHRLLRVAHCVRQVNMDRSIMLGSGTLDEEGVLSHRCLRGLACVVYSDSR